MDNRLKNNLIEEKLAEPRSRKPKRAKNQFFVFLSKGMISKESATAMLPFIIYLALLALIYIGNRHFVEANIRRIDRLTKEVKELSWDYKLSKAALMLKRTETEVAKAAAKLGLKVPIVPPKKIVISKDLNEH